MEFPSELEEWIKKAKKPRGELYGNDFEAGYHNGARAMAEHLMPLVEALEFYRKQQHIHDYGGTNFTPNGECCPHYSEPETVSGEPMNYYEGHGDYGFEDGSFARKALESVGLGGESD